MENYTFRLRSGQDLFDSIESFVQENRIEAGCVLSSVGSLTRAFLRLANRDLHTEYNGYFEIVSMTGTVSLYGSHLHLSISEGEGRTTGGRLPGLHHCRNRAGGLLKICNLNFILPGMDLMYTII